MQLGDVGRLSSFGREAWGAFGRRLRAIGLDEAAVTPFWALARRGGGPLRDPIVKWRLRREGSLPATAMRMFVFCDPVTPGQARTTLGDELPLEKALEAGLLTRTPAGDVVSPFAMSMPCIGGATFVFADDLAAGGDAVMPPSGLTWTLARFACPPGRVEQALDVGCGPGTLALAIAPACARVVATDVNPRALALAQANAWMNGFDHIELRRGDLLEPVAGESFDLVVSQPPFVPRPAGMPATPYLFGGERGDELPLRALAGIMTAVGPDGLALLGIGWPLVEGEPPLLQRLRDALGPALELTLLVLFGATGDIADQSRTYGSIEHVDDRESRERDVIRFQEHFEQHKIRGVVDTYMAVRRHPWLEGWTSCVSLDKLAAAPASRETIDRLLAEGDRSAGYGPRF